LLILSKEAAAIFDSHNNFKSGRCMIAVHPGPAEFERNSFTGLLCYPESKEIVKNRNAARTGMNLLNGICHKRNEIII